MKISQILLWLIVLLGLALRFQVQFLEPFFNNDEIDLGMNINQRGYLDLLSPLKHYQTAPPLFLWLMKLIYSIPFGDSWLRYKVFFFLLNIPFFYLFYSWAKRYISEPRLLLVAMAMVCLNPFFIYHGLTLKQYILDVVIVLLIVKSDFKRESNPWYKVLWVLAPLISNPILFVYSGYLIRVFLRLLLSNDDTAGKSILKKFLNAITGFLKEPLYRWLYLPLFIYVTYFIWYKQQSGYLELTHFMWNFWKLTFFSNPNDFFIRIYYFFIGNVTFIFSHDKTLANLGTLLFFIGLVRFYRSNTNSSLKRSLGFYMGAMAVFIVLNFLKMYPIAPRLLLFFAPAVVLLIVYSGQIKNKVYSVLWLVIVSVGLGNYALYFPFKENDVLEMAKRLELLKPKQTFYSMNSIRAIKKFDAFTEGAFNIQNKHVFITQKKNPSSSDSLFVLKLVHQFGRNGLNGPIMEPCIPAAVEAKRIVLVDAADGFNIYAIKDKSIVEEFTQQGILHPDYLNTGSLKKQDNPFCYP